jgi:hypothetical protein
MRGARSQQRGASRPDFTFIPTFGAPSKLSGLADALQPKVARSETPTGPQDLEQHEIDSHRGIDRHWLAVLLAWQELPFLYGFDRFFVEPESIFSLKNEPGDGSKAIR